MNIKNKKNSQCKLHLSVDSQQIPCGTKFKTHEFPEKLGVFVNNCGKGYYSWCFWDVDAPSPDYLHWIVLNAESIHEGTDYLVYQPPTPPVGTGAHRYILGLWRHSLPVPVPNKGIEQRWGQDARALMEELVGNAEWIGSSFIFVEN